MNARNLAWFALAPVAFGFTFAGDTYTFNTHPTKGYEATYVEKVELTLSGSAIVQTDKRIDTYTEVNPDGSMVVKSLSEDVKATINGQEVPIPEQPAVTITSDPAGIATKVEGGPPDPNIFRIIDLSVLLAPEKPVKVGDSWTRTIPTNKTTGAPAFTATYKVMGTEKIGTWNTVKVQTTIAETEGTTKASATGFQWVDPTNDVTIKTDFTIKNLPLPQGAADATITATRTK